MIFPNCTICLRKRSFHDTRIGKYLCSSCYSKELDKADPLRKEKRRKYQREHARKKRGVPIDAPITKAPNGNGHLNKSGYKVLTKKDHPNSSSNGTILEHTFIMSIHLGRPLFKQETVHHKNGIRHDNRIENLELWSKNHGPGQRVEDKINFYKEFLEKYGYEVKNLNEPSTLS